MAGPQRCSRSSAARPSRPADRTRNRDWPVGRPSLVTHRKPPHRSSGHAQTPTSKSLSP
jgi:hypothetical protein